MVKQREYFLRVGDRSVLYYVSSHCRTWRPAKSLVVFAPSEVAGNVDSLRQFALDSGWKEAAEADGAVVSFPTTACGWEQEDPVLPKRIYQAVWKDAPSPEPNDFRGNVWCWECLVFGIGYADGAVLVGNAAVAHPNTFAGAIMVGGQPSDYSVGDQVTDRWMLPDAAPIWQKTNKETPVEVLFVTKEDVSKAKEYFLSTACSENQVSVLSEEPVASPALTAQLMDYCSTRIRWKNSPDGTASRCLSKEEFYHSGEFRHEEVVVNGVPYAFHIKQPKNAPADAKLPVVLLLHGHGEPAWLFCYKNGWAELADETGEFVLVLPDSPENAWKVERDENLFEVLLAKLDEVTSVDLERVYLTGFSNGSLATCWYGERHPHLFAAIAPWNSPMVCYEDELLASGYELPIFAINGDLDHKMDVPRRFYPEFFSAFLRLNEGTPVPGGDGPVGLVPDEVWDSENCYTVANGYEQGQRMTSYVFHDKNGCAKVSYTQISEMPHGAIPDEARATWTFIRRFRRPANSKTIEMVEQHVLN